MLINYTVIWTLLWILGKWYAHTSMSKKLAVAFLCYLAITITRFVFHDFLSLAPPNKNEYQPINISLLLNEIIEFMKPYGTISGVQILDEIPDELYINGYHHEFKQLVINLMKNGIEAMPNGGKLMVTASSDHQNQFVKINDEGVGLSEAQLRQLGQPYYSTKTRCTGLGLLISYDIIKRMR
ncbi:ATP-binding protein [Neobacillus sp. Marseille-QA0830]